MTDLFQDATTIDPIVDETKNYLEELVGENKKFKDVQALARGKYEADITVESRNRELKELRDAYLNVIEENKAKARLEELVDQLSQRASSSNTQPQNANDTDTQAFDPKQVDDIFRSRISEWELQKRQEANLQSVQSKLRERYGNNYTESLKQRARELNLTTEEANDLAKNRPELFSRAFELDRPASTQPFQSPPHSSRMSDPFAPAAPDRTWSYYQKMKKSDPKLYKQPKTQIQMQKDMESLGEAFKDGDYNAF